MKCTRISIIFIAIVGYFVPRSHTTDTRNAIILLADDGGFEMGAYLNKICQTPNLDKLAKRSVIFNNAFTSVSSCSPSRAALLTGLPSHQNGMYGLHNDIHHFNTLPNVRSLPKVLTKNNIRTGIIGKKHVGPNHSFKFDYERTEEHYSINQVGRNITKIKLLVREFLSQQKNDSQPFFLLVAFHDPHRCGRVTPQYGSFCQRWGSGQEGMGVIPDWAPIYYQWDELEIPYYVPDTEDARRDLAAQYTTISRLDQGVGLVLEELRNAGLDDSTLIIYTSDNGPPMPSGRTNLYDPGVREPMFISSPKQSRRNEVTNAMSSLLDIYPTILEWFGIKYAENGTLKHPSHRLTGKSLLPLLNKEPPYDPDAAVFASQNLHEITMSYPMRSIRTNRYKLIHNLNSNAPFPIDQDFYMSPTFQDILNRTIEKQPLPWYKTLHQYYKRPEWEMYDLKMDPLELRNIVDKPSMSTLRDSMKKRLYDWQVETNDPWRCFPHGVLQDKGDFKNNPQCLTLGHEATKL